MMNVKELTAAIAVMTDAESIKAVTEAVAERRRYLARLKREAEEAARKSRDAETMATVKNWKPGQTVYFHKEMERGWMDMGNLKITRSRIAAGSKATVHSVQPKAGRVWLKVPESAKPRYRGGIEYFTADDIRRYDISRTEPAVRKALAET